MLTQYYMLYHEHKRELVREYAGVCVCVRVGVCMTLHVADYM